MAHFEPADKAEHERANQGSGEPDYCANCGRPFMTHYNGRCPEPRAATPKTGGQR